MRVLFRIRSDIAKYPGGDEVQLRHTREALEALGVETMLAPGVGNIPGKFDLVHLFNTTRIHETALQLRQAQRAGIPVVVSPIWHSNREMGAFYSHLYGRSKFPLALYQGAKEAWYARRSGQSIYWPAVFNIRALQRRVAAQADALLPNSLAELSILCQELHVTPKAVFIIPYGFALGEQSIADRTAAQPRRDVLCVGRIEPRKNQLQVIRAFKQLPRSEHRLLLYGAINEKHARFNEEVRAELVPGWVEYRGCVSQQELYAIYRNTTALVLASYFETCGLVAMEALACGANACITDSPYSRDHYGDHVTYCDPYSVESIRQGIAAVLAGQTDAPKWPLKQYTWQEVAEKTLEAYQRVLAVKS